MIGFPYRFAIGISIVIALFGFKDSSPGFVIGAIIGLIAALGIHELRELGKRS